MIDPVMLPLRKLLPLHRTPWYLRWRGPWRFLQQRPGDGFRWRYLSANDYYELFHYEAPLDV